MKKLKYLFLILLLIPFHVKALEKPNLYSEKYIIYDKTDNKVLAEEKSNEKSSIASLTKIMTTITAIEKIKNLNEKVTVTSKMLQGIVWDASVAGLKVGDTVTYLDLLYASILPSGADATNILAHSLSGSVENFVLEMNENAKKLRMNSTNFVNVTGLDIENHYSSAKDILKLLKYSLENDLFKKIYTTNEYTLTNGLKVKSTIEKYSQKLNVDTKRILGSKTGYTGNAGLCLSYLINSSNHEILIITLNANPTGKNKHIKDALEIIDYLDKNYQNQTLIKKEEVLKTIPVKLSTQDKYKIKAPKKVTKFLPNNYDKSKLKIKYHGQEELNCFTKKGTLLGKVTYYYENEKLTASKIYLEEELKIDFIKILKLTLPIISILLVILLIIKKLTKKKLKNNK